MTAKILGLDRAADWFRKPGLKDAGLRLCRVKRNTTWHQPPTPDEWADWLEANRPRRQTTARRRAL